MIYAARQAIRCEADGDGTLAENCAMMLMKGWDGEKEKIDPQCRQRLGFKLDAAILIHETRVM